LQIFGKVNTFKAILSLIPFAILHLIILSYDIYYQIINSSYIYDNQLVYYAIGGAF